MRKCGAYLDAGERCDECDKITIYIPNSKDLDQFIHESEAYEYAVKKMNKDYALRCDFVEWFYGAGSGYKVIKISESNLCKMIERGEMGNDII